MVLGRLQSKGLIRRQSTNGRLDNQRYGYIRWEDSPCIGSTMTLDEALTETARRFFRWIGPAEIESFGVFAGLSGKGARIATASLGLMETEPGSNLWGYPEDVEGLRSFEIPKEPQYSLVSTLDGILLHRREVLTLLDPEDRNRTMPGEKQTYEMGSVQELTCNAILDRGRIVGLWEFDSEAQSLVWTMFGEPNADVRQAVAVTEKYIQEDLQDARSFSLDSPASRRGKLAALRAMGNGGG